MLFIHSILGLSMTDQSRMRFDKFFIVYAEAQRVAKERDKIQSKK